MVNKEYNIIEWRRYVNKIHLLLTLKTLNSEDLEHVKRCQKNLGELEDWEKIRLIKIIGRYLGK